MKGPNRLDAVREAVKTSSPRVFAVEDVPLLQSPEFKKGWELAVKDIQSKIEFALTGELRDVRRSMQTWK